MTITACLILTVLLVAFIARGRGSETVLEAGSYSAEKVSLQDQRERCLQVIRDLELDRATDKVTEEEYGKMRRSVERDLARILERLRVPGEKL